MTDFENLSFIDNPAIARRADHYETIIVDIGKIIQSWRLSLFSYEWLRPDGTIKDFGDLSPGEQAKRSAVENFLRNNEPLEKPVLGIGLLENVEIGAGRATFLTLAAHGVKQIPVHISRSNADEFEPFRAIAAESTRHAG